MKTWHTTAGRQEKCTNKRETMAILVTCGACEKQFEVPDELAGQTGSCECGASVDIPGGAEPVAAESNPYSAPETAVEAAVAPATGAYDATELAGLKTCKSGFGLMYTAVLVALVGFVLFVIGLFSAGSSVGAGDASGAASGGLMMLAAMGAFGIGGLLHIIGSGMLMAAPGRSEAKGLFQLSFFSYIGALLLPFFGMDIMGLAQGGEGLGILSALRTMLGMFLAAIALQVTWFVAWAVGTSRLSTFINDAVNAARAKFAIKLFVTIVAVFAVGVVAADSVPLLALVVPLVLLVLQIVLLIVMIRCYKAGKDSIGRITG